MKEVDITDDILYKHSDRAEKIILSQIPKDEDLNHIFSDEFELKIAKLIKKEKRKSIIKTMTQSSKRIAIVFLIILSGIVTVTMNVEAIRVKVLNVITEIYTEFTSFIFSTDDNDEATTFKPLEPKYITQGYSEVERFENPIGLFIVYENSEKLQIRYTADDINNNSVILDTENAIVEEIDINEYKAKYITKNNTQQLFWNDNKILYWLDQEVSNEIVSELDKEELIKIAKSIKK